MPSPTPEYNFAVEPTVTSLDDFWHLKYDEDEEGRAVRKEKADELVDELIQANGNPDHEIHLPAPSYFPFIVGLGIMFIAYGIMYHTRPYGIPMLAAGAFVAIGALFAWGSEPLEEVHDKEHGDHADDAHDGDAEPALSEGDA